MGRIAATWRTMAALAIWSFLVWVLLTWTLTWSQLSFGAGVAVAVAAGCTGLGPVAAPWALVDPRRLSTGALLAGRVAWRIVWANCSLARRIWDPRLPLRSGMVVVPTWAEATAAYVTVGLLTSVIVDNQLVDVDRRGRLLQYHAVWVTSEDPLENYRRVNGPVEVCANRLVEP